MKSAYELAMERLAKDQPIMTLTEDQKKQLAEIDSQFKARIAEREVFLKDQTAKAQAAGKFEEVESLQKQLSSELRRLQEDCEAKKEKLRAGFGGK
jgi:aminopeptidase N